MGRMISRVGQFSRRLIETGWLAAVIVVPLFFNVWTDRVFEPDKLSLLRTIALLIAAAAVVLVLERGLPSATAVRRWLAIPLVGPVLLLSAVYLFAAAASVTPYISFVGSHTRLQGAYSWLAYVAVFLAIVTLLARRSQAERLLDALILPSLPIALYGIVQRFGVDPMPWLGDVTVRVASTMGNSIFVAAYLILVVPLTAVQLVAALRRLSTDESNAAVLRVAAYILLLTIQIIAIVLSQSRGPLLGLLGGMFFVLLLLAAMRGGRRWILAVLGLGALAAAFLVVFNLPGSPLAPLRDVAYLGRLGRVFETESGTGKVRVLIWQGATELINADPVRRVIGYGPESMQWAYNPYYPPELGDYESRNASPDRSHNETFDALATTGVIGFAAYLYLFTSLFYYGLKWLGLIQDARQRNLFLLLWLGGGALSALAFQLWRGSATFFGVAVPAGAVLGLFIYLAARSLAGWRAEEKPGSLLLAGLMAALIAHFIEIHFGIAIAATRTLFFAMAGLAVVIGTQRVAEPAAAAAPVAGLPAKRRKAATRRPQAAVPRPTVARLTSLAFLLLTVLITLTFAFVVRPEMARLNLMVLVWLMGLTWAIGTLVLASDMVTAGMARLLPGLGHAGEPADWLAGTGRYLAISLGGWLGYLLVHWLVLRQGEQSSSGADTSSMLLLLYEMVLVTTLVLWAVALARSDPQPAELSQATLSLWLYPAVGVAAVALAFFTNVNEVRADIYFKQAFGGYHREATAYESKGDSDTAQRYFDEAIEDYRRAIALDPRDDYYQLFLGKAILEKADSVAQQLEDEHAEEVTAPGFSEYDSAATETAAAARDKLFNEALQVLRRAESMAPLNTDHKANLARAYQIWGDRTFEGTRRAERLALSRQWFERAIAQSPHNAGLREEAAMTEFLDDQPDVALRRIDEALTIDPKYTHPYRLRASIYREQEQFAESEADYRRYLESSGQSDALAWSGYALVLGRQGKLAEAREANGHVLELAPDDVATLRNLAILSRDLEDRESGCEYVRRGLELAPDDTTFQGLAADLGCSL
jgi:tetratricopeptide (TPR) repeat protein/O-antigen ligase